MNVVSVCSLWSSSVSGPTWPSSTRCWRSWLQNTSRSRNPVWRPVSDDLDDLSVCPPVCLSVSLGLSNRISSGALWVTYSLTSACGQVTASTDYLYVIWGMTFVCEETEVQGAFIWMKHRIMRWAAVNHAREEQHNETEQGAKHWLIQLPRNQSRSVMRNRKATCQPMWPLFTRCCLLVIGHQTVWSTAEVGQSKSKRDCN